MNTLKTFNQYNQCLNEYNEYFKDFQSIRCIYCILWFLQGTLLWSSKYTLMIIKIYFDDLQRSSKIL